MSPTESTQDPLREAARALLAAWDGPDAAVADAHFDRLRAALAASPSRPSASWRAIYERLFEKGPDSFSQPERETIRDAIEEAWNAGAAASPSRPDEREALIADFYRWTQEAGQHGTDCPYGRELGARPGDTTARERQEKGCTCGLWDLERRADALLNGPNADPFPAASPSREAPAHDCVGSDCWCRYRLVDAPPPPPRAVDLGQIEGMVDALIILGTRFGLATDDQETPIEREIAAARASLLSAVAAVVRERDEAVAGWKAATADADALHDSIVETEMGAALSRPSVPEPTSSNEEDGRNG
jgi:hypothetical protein